MSRTARQPITPAQQEFMNVRWIVTIRRDMIPDETTYCFADPKFIGRAYTEESSCEARGDKPADPA